MTSNARRAVFVCDTRLPSEKAHSYHAMKSCEGLSALGFDVSLLVPRRHPRRARLGPADIFSRYSIPRNFSIRILPNIDVVRLERILPASIYQALFRIRAFLWAALAALTARRAGADVHFTTDVDAAFWLTMLGLPTIYEVHRVPRRLGARLLRRAVNRESLRSLIALTTIAGDELIALGAPSERTLVFGEGVDLEAFQQVPSKEQCRLHLGLPIDRPVIAYVGRFLTMGQEKGIPELVRAMASVTTADGREPLLVCVGGPLDVVGTYREIARDAGTPENRLQFVDMVPHDEVPMWLRAADVGAMPFPASVHYERYMSPMKLFEYMAAGLPIVATDLPALRDVLTHDVDAWLVPPDDPSALAEGLSRLLHDVKLRARLGERASKDVVSHDWPRRASTIITFFDAGRSAPFADHAHLDLSVDVAAQKRVAVPTNT